MTQLSLDVTSCHQMYSLKQESAFTPLSLHIRNAIKPDFDIRHGRELYRELHSFYCSTTGLSCELPRHITIIVVVEEVDERGGQLAGGLLQVLIHLQPGWGGSQTWLWTFMSFGC